MDWLFTAAYTFLFIAFIIRARFFHIDGVYKLIPAGVFTIKLLAGLLLVYIYTHIYTNRSLADIFRYYDDSATIYNSLFTHPSAFFKLLLGIKLEDASMTSYYDAVNCWEHSHISVLSRINAVIRLFSMGYYTVHVLIFCFISFTGQMAIYKVFASNTAETYKKHLLLIVIFLVPSTLLWSSGILKESIAFFAFGTLLYHLTQVTKDDKVKKQNIIWIILSLLLLLENKSYILLTAIIPLILYCYWLIPSSKTYLKYSMLVLLVFSIALITSIYNIPINIAAKQQDFIQLGLHMKANSLLTHTPLESTWSYIILNTPRSIFTVFTEPLVNINAGLFSNLAAIENIFILLCLLTAVGFASLKNLQNPLVYFSILFTLLLFALIGLSTPVAGAMVRYKSIALPFLLGACVLLLNTDKIKKIKS